MDFKSIASADSATGPCSFRQAKYYLKQPF
jgi:hypothetical protein